MQTFVNMLDDYKYLVDKLSVSISYVIESEIAETGNALLWYLKRTYYV